MNGNIKPFIKWVGGKTQLLNPLNELISINDIDTYVEPFVGGGALLFSLLNSYDIKNVIINDININLINLYKDIKNNPLKLIDGLRILQDEYYSLNEENVNEYFLQKRQEFNDKIDDKSALFIFLNKTCFNGLYRVNSKGFFNVPCGYYKTPKICDADVIMADSQALQKTTILCGDYSQVLDYVGRKTLVYLDPPYKPITKTSSFTSYDKSHFDDAEQVKLRDFCVDVDKRGGKFILSNSNNSYFDELYKDFTIDYVQANRMVNCDGDKRGKIKELLIHN